MTGSITQESRLICAIPVTITSQQHGHTVLAAWRWDCPWSIRHRLQLVGVSDCLTIDNGILKTAVDTEQVEMPCGPADWSRSIPISKQKYLPTFWRRFVPYAIFWLTKLKKEEKKPEKNTWYLLIVIHMKHITVLGFDDISDRNLGIIFNGASTQLFRPGKWVIRLGQRSTDGRN